VATVLWRKVKSVTVVMARTSLADLTNVAKVALELRKNLEIASSCQGKLAGWYCFVSDQKCCALFC